MNEIEGRWGMFKIENRYMGWGRGNNLEEKGEGLSNGWVKIRGWGEGVKGR